MAVPKFARGGRSFDVTKFLPGSPPGVPGNRDKPTPPKPPKRVSYYGGYKPGK